TCAASKRERRPGCAAGRSSGPCVLFDPATARRLFLGAMICAGIALTRPAAADESLTRVYGTTRPFFAAVGSGFAALNTLGLEHDFANGLALGLEVAPLALVFDGDATGAVTHARAHVGFASEFLAVGAGVGGHVQHYGASGLSLASTLRLGSLDGLH